MPHIPAISPRAPRVSRGSALATATMALMLSTQSAMALEGKALLEKILAEAGPKPVTLTYGSLDESSGDTFTMRDVKLDAEGRATPVSIEVLSVKGLVEDGDKRVKYDAIAISGISQETNARGGTFTIATIASSEGAVPWGIWKDGLDDAEKKEVVRFGTLSITDMKGENDKRDSMGGIDSIVLNGFQSPVSFDLTDTETPADPSRYFKLKSGVLSNLYGSGQGVDVKLGTVSIGGINFPNTGAADYLAMMRSIGGITLGDFSVQMGGQTAVSLDALTAAAQPESDTKFSSVATMSGLKVNFGALPDKTARDAMAQLGYDSLEAGMSATSSYDATSGEAELSNFQLDLKDMLKLALSYKISGYTAELAQKLQKAQLDAQAKGGDQSAALMELLPLLTQLQIDNLKLDITDQSLTQKLLDFQGKQMGTTGEQLAQGAPMMLGMGMASLGMPALTEMITTAVGTFLQKQGTLSASVEPGDPVSLGTILQAYQTNPKTLPELLNFKVSAQ